MKYKVGDKVRVRADLKIYGTYGGYYVTDNMHKMTGKTVTISSVCKYVYEICEDNGKCYWTDELFEPAAKDLLKPGSVVEIRTGEKYLYLNDVFLSENGGMCLNALGLEEYTDDLLDNDGNGICKYDIQKIYRTSGRKMRDLFTDKYLTLVWKREEPKEMTLEEVEKELGYPIKIVKGE